MFKQVLVAVEQDTGGGQIPWVASSLRGEFYFLPATATLPAPTEPGTGTPAAVSRFAISGDANQTAGDGEGSGRRVRD